MVRSDPQPDMLQMLLSSSRCSMSVLHTKKIFYFCSFSFAHLDVSRTDDLAKRASP